MLTKLKNFSFLTNDLAFKKVFSHEDILTDFFCSFLEYLNISDNIKFKSIISQKYLESSNKHSKAFFSDIVGVDSLGNIIFLEMYSNTFNLRYYNKSLSYLCRLFNNQIKPGDYKYEDMHKVIGINLINSPFTDNKSIVNKYTFRNNITSKTELPSNLIIYNIRLDKVRNMVYNNTNKRFIKWLKLINSKSIEEMEKYAKGDKIMENSIRVLKEWNEERDKDAVERYYGEKMLEVKEEGIEQGLEQGMAKEKKSIAKQMLKDSLPIKSISKYTGLSLKEINSLK